MGFIPSSLWGGGRLRGVCHPLYAVNAVPVWPIHVLSVRCGSQKGGGNFKLVGFNQATGLVWPLRRQICLSPVWLGGLRSCGSAELSLGPFGLARDQTGGLIES